MTFESDRGEGRIETRRTRIVAESMAYNKDSCGIGNTCVCCYSVTAILIKCDTW